MSESTTQYVVRLSDVNASIDLAVDLLYRLVPSELASEAELRSPIIDQTQYSFGIVQTLSFYSTSDDEDLMQRVMLSSYEKNFAAIASMWVEGMEEAAAFGIVDGILFAFSNEGEAEVAILSGMEIDEIEFFQSDSSTTDRMLLRVHGGPDQYRDELYQVCYRFLSELEPMSVDELARGIDTLANKKLGPDFGLEIFDTCYPHFKEGRQMYFSPPEIGGSLIYLSRDDKSLFIGFEYSELSRYIDDNCNFGMVHEPHLSNLAYVFHWASGSEAEVVLRARCNKLNQKNKEAWFSEFEGHFYYNERTHY